MPEDYSDVKKIRVDNGSWTIFLFDFTSAGLWLALDGASAPPA